MCIAMATRVLLCDSSEGIALLEYALIRTPPDVEIEVGTDGYRAVELAARTKPDVIVVEVALPGLSGADEDVIEFTPTALGFTTAGVYRMYLDLSTLGITTDVAGLEIVP